MKIKINGENNPEIIRAPLWVLLTSDFTIAINGQLFICLINHSFSRSDKTLLVLSIKVYISFLAKQKDTEIQFVFLKNSTQFQLKCFLLFDKIN